MNLMTSGLSNALMSAKSYSVNAISPAQKVSREFKSVNPDLEYIQKHISASTTQMNYASQATELAKSELIKANQLAQEKNRAQMEERLAEQAEERRNQNKNNNLYNIDNSDRKSLYQYNTSGSSSQSTVKNTALYNKIVTDTTKTYNSVGSSSIFQQSSSSYSSNSYNTWR